MDKKNVSIEDIKKTTVEFLTQDTQKEVKGGADLIVHDDLNGF